MVLNLEVEKKQFIGDLGMKYMTNASACRFFKLFGITGLNKNKQLQTRRRDEEHRCDYRSF